MRLVRQPKNSLLCGQSCVAMVAGISLKAAIKLVGHSRPTYKKDICRGLKIRSSRIKRFTIRLKKRSIIYVRFKNYNRGHWVVFDGMRILDPMFNRKQTLKTFKKRMSQMGGVLICYFEID